MTRRLLLIALGTAALTSVAAAQTAPPLLSISRAQVLPGRMAEYLEVQKQISQAYKKGGAAFRYVLVGVIGNPNEVLTVSGMSSYADRDADLPARKTMTDAQWVSLLARRSQCTVSVRTTLERTLPEQSIAMPDQPVPKMVRETRTRVRPNMQAQYMALVKSDLLPALKKLDVKTYRMRQIQWGGSRVEFAATSGMDKWAELDGAANRLEGAMGKEAYAKYLEKMSAIIAFTEYTIYTLNADASFRN